MRISLGYPSWEAEKSMLRKLSEQPDLPVTPVITPEQLQHYQRQVNAVHCSDSILDYILKLVNESREQAGYPQPLSPRASRALLNAAKSWAFIHDRDYVVPEDIQAVFAAVAEHRLQGQQQEWVQESALSRQLLESVDPLAA